MFQIIIHQWDAAIAKPPFELSRLPSIWLDFIIYATQRHFHQFHPFLKIKISPSKNSNFWKSLSWLIVTEDSSATQSVASRDSRVTVPQSVNKLVQNRLLEIHWNFYFKISDNSTNQMSVCISKMFLTWSEEILSKIFLIMAHKNANICSLSITHSSKNFQFF